MFLITRVRDEADGETVFPLFVTNNKVHADSWVAAATVEMQAAATIPIVYVPGPKRNAYLEQINTILTVDTFIDRDNFSGGSYLSYEVVELPYKEFPDA